MTEKEKPIALESRAAIEARMFSPSASRNRDAVRDIFLKHMPARGEIVEIASGSGEHVVHLAAAARDLYFRPGDPDAASRASIAAWIAHEGLENVAAPHAADMRDQDWPDQFSPVEGIMSLNMIHIAPFAAAQGLFAGAARLLKPQGRLFLYGPFSRNGFHTAPSNAEFDASLKLRDPAWGVRDLDRDIAPLAEASGFRLIAVEAMPANNFSVIFEET